MNTHDDLLRTMQQLHQELSELRSHLNQLKKAGLVSENRLPRAEVMTFFGYADTQMSTLEKSENLTVAKVGNRKFYHRASIDELLRRNCQS